MEAWATIHRRRDVDAAATSTGMISSVRASHAVYELQDFEVDKPIKKPQTIEAVLTSSVAWSDLAPLVFIGTSDGSLHSYVPCTGSASQSDDGALGGTRALRLHTTYRKVFHSSAQFLDSWGVFLTLCDTKLALFTLPLQSNSQVESSGSSSSLMKGIGIGSSSSSSDDTMLSVLDETKQTTLFAAHEGAKVVVSISKQLTLRVFDWTASRALALRTQHELPLLLARSAVDGSSALAPTALSVLQLIVMGESHVFLQLKREWCVLNVDSGRVIRVRAQDASTAQSFDAIACAVAVPSRQLALRHPSHELRDVFVAGKHSAAVVALAVDNEDDEAATIIDETRRANPQNVSDDRVCVKVERVLEYNAAPRAAFYHHPLLLLEHQDAVVVHNVATMRAVQRLPTKSLYSAAAAVALDAYASPLESASDAPATLVAVAAPFTVQLLTMAPMARVVKDAMAHKRLNEAVAICKLCPEHCGLADDERHALLAARAFELFQSGQHRRAMTLFLESELDVIDVLCALYPRDLLPRSASSSGRTTTRGAAGTTLAQLVASSPASGALTGDALVQSLLALILLLRHKRDVIAHTSAATTRSAESAWHRSLSQDAQRATSATSSTAAAMNALEVIDTVLLKCLVLLCEKPEVAPSAGTELMDLVTQPNACEMSEAEIFLRAHRQFPALLRFYTMRKEHRKALELLEDLERSASAKAASAETAPRDNHSSSSSSATFEMTDTQTSESYMVLITEYLQRLGQSKVELVFEFSRRVVAVRPALGLAIFTDRRVPEAKEDIDPAAILSHLKTCELQAQPIESEGGESALNDRAASADASTAAATLTLPLINTRFLAIEYLTQVILSSKAPVAPRLHDEVVYLLLDAITTELQSTRSSASRLTSRVSAQRGLVGMLRMKLMLFLESDVAAYHPERMLSRTPVEMVDERAALLSKLGRHHEVLQLYAIDLKDASLAESYCNRCYDAKLADSSIYSALLRLYLRPLPSQLAAMGSLSPGKPTTAAPPLLWRSTSSHLAGSSASSSSSSLATSPSSEAVAAAVSVLNKYPERIDVPTALELLPPDVSVASLAFFFRRVLECQVERSRNGQVKKQLSKMANFTVRQTLATKRKGSVTVWPSHSCHVCGKRLGTGTFVRLPGGTLLHYACQPVN